MATTIVTALVILIATIPVEAETGDVISSNAFLVVFEIDRGDYGYWLSSNEAYLVVYDKIIPGLQEARPSYRTYFDSKPTHITSKYTFEQILAKDLAFHYNFLRWDGDIGYNDWYISRDYWNE